MTRASDTSFRAAEAACRAARIPVPVSGDGGSMHTMLKRHEIQVLRRAGISLKETSRLTGASARTIRRVMEEPPVEAVDGSAARQARSTRRCRCCRCTCPTTSRTTC